MKEQKFIYDCGICGAAFQFGPHLYEGKHIPSYNLTVCKTCWEVNWDGWGPGAERALLAHLERQGLPLPERNSKGWLPRESGR